MVGGLLLSSVASGPFSFPKQGGVPLRKGSRSFFAPRLESLESRALPASIDFASGILVTLTPTLRPGYWTNPIVGSELLKTWDLVPGLGLWSVPQSMTVDSAIAKISLDKTVVRVEPNRVMDSKSLFNDPSYSQQWGLSNNGVDGALPGADIHAEAALSRFEGTGGTLVAIIDTGVDYTHPELSSRMWVNPGEIPGNGIDDDKDGFVDDIHGANFVSGTGNPMDDNGHGTHVAGIIAATANNGIGLVGVNPNTRIMALKFLDSQGFGDLTGAISALDYAVSKGALISNNSWGGAGFSATLSDAISRARLKGHIVVAAAGNDSLNIDTSASYPASFSQDNVVVVASTSAQDRLSWFSNYGATGVDLGAPGEAILSTLPGGKYGTLTGTSMATPFVTGALSLLWDRRPDMGYRELINTLLGQTDLLASLRGKSTSGGRLNLDKALAAVESQGVDTTLPYVISGDFSGDASAQISRLRLEFSEPINASTLVDNVVLTNPSGVSIPVTWTAISGQSSKVFSGTIAPQTALGVYTLLVKPGVRDLRGNALDQNRNAVAGETADNFRVTTTLAASASWSNPTKISIRDLRTITSVIAVPAGVSAQRIQVGMNITHGDLSDLYITLKSPAGRVFVLVNRNATGQNFRNLILEDSATTAFADGVAPYAGTYRPAQAMGSLGGISAQGNWTLSVTDRALVDQGTLNSWSLRFVSESATGQKLQVRGSSFIASSGVSASMLGGGGSLLLSMGQEIKPTKQETLADMVFHEGPNDNLPFSSRGKRDSDLASHHPTDFHAGANGSVNDFAFADYFALGAWNGELGVATGIASARAATAGEAEISKPVETASSRFRVGPLNRNAAVAEGCERVVLAQNKVRLAGMNNIVRDQAKGPFGLGVERPEN